MGGKRALISLPEFPAHRLAQDARGDDPARVLIQLFKFSNSCISLAVSVCFLPSFHTSALAMSTVAPASSTLSFGAG